jgi:hypothetical protein
MIKRQYKRSEPGYFFNFINFQPDMDVHIEDGLAPYKATLGKSKNRHSKLNVKWHDEKLYMLFVLRWS